MTARRTLIAIAGLAVGCLLGAAAQKHRDGMSAPALEGDELATPELPKLGTQPQPRKQSLARRLVSHALATVRAVFEGVLPSQFAEPGPLVFLPLPNGEAAPSRSATAQQIRPGHSCTEVPTLLETAVLVQRLQSSHEGLQSSQDCQSPSPGEFS